MLLNWVCNQCCRCVWPVRAAEKCQFHWADLSPHVYTDHNWHICPMFRSHDKIDWHFLYKTRKKQTTKQKREINHKRTIGMEWMYVYRRNAMPWNESRPASKQIERTTISSSSAAAAIFSEDYFVFHKSFRRVWQIPTKNKQRRQKTHTHIL